MSLLQVEWSQVEHELASVHPHSCIINVLDVFYDGQQTRAILKPCNRPLVIWRGYAFYLIYFPPQRYLLKKEVFWWDKSGQGAQSEA